MKSGEAQESLGSVPPPRAYHSAHASAAPTASSRPAVPIASAACCRHAIASAAARASTATARASV